MVGTAKSTMSIRITYEEYIAKKDDVFKKLGVEIKHHSHQDRLDKLEELLAEGIMGKEMYDKKLKRILQDIKDES